MDFKLQNEYRVTMNLCLSAFQSAEWRMVLPCLLFKKINTRLFYSKILAIRKS